jgi:hypothetical protein
MIQKLLIVIIIIFLANYAKAKDAGETAANFLKIGISPRATSLANAYSAISDDVSAIYYNPAGLTQLKYQQILIMHNNWFEDINQQFLAFTHFINKNVLGISLNYLDIGKIQETTYENKTGTGRFFRPKDLALTVAYARQIKNNLSFGINFKFIQQMIYDKKANTWASDLGILYEYLPKLKFALVLQNIGSKLKFIEKSYSLPFISKFGLLYIRDKSNFCFEAILPSDNDIRFCIGIEHKLVERLTLRLGYCYKDEDLGRLHSLPEGIGLGLGFKFSNIALDYAYTPYGLLGDTHRVSILIKFKEVKLPPKKPKILKITTDNVNIYTGPGAFYSIMITLDKDTTLILIDDSNKWYYKVRLPDGRIGWVSYVYVE